MPVIAPPKSPPPAWANQPEPAAWIDPVGLIGGLAVGLAITWVYARYFQNL